MNQQARPQHPDADRERYMAIAFIQQGMGLLDPETKRELEQYEYDGRSWREYIVHRLNGAALPVPFVLLALRKRWRDCPHKNRELFTRQILVEWGLL